MRRILWAAALSATAAFAQCGYSPTTLSLPDSSYPANTYASGTTTYQAVTSITAAGSGNSLTVDGSANVTFVAGSTITLLPGFTAVGGSGSPTFQAMIAPVSQYELTTAIYPSSTAGTVTASPCSSSGYYSAGTVVTLTANPNSGYQFANWSTGATTSTISVTMSSAKSITANFAAASPLLTFTNCVSSSGTGSTCTLPPGRYDITQTILIGRSNITVQGGGTSRSQTLLVRDPAFPATNSADCKSNPGSSDCGSNAPLMAINPSGSQPLTGVVIQNLTFCGNSNINPNSPSPCPTPPVPPNTNNCSDRTTYETENPPYPNPYPFQLCVDLFVYNADTGQNPADPFTYTGPYSVEITNVDFEDGASHAVALWPNISSQRANDININNSVIAASGVTGILIGANGTPYGPTGRLCDQVPNYPNDPSLGLPRDILIEYNTFQNNNTSSVASETGRWVQLSHNTFTNNYTDPQVKGNEAGGNVFIDACSDTLQIYHNTMNGPTYINTSGLELWGRNVDAEWNQIYGYPNEGIAANSTYSATIANNTLQNNDTNLRTLSYSIGGIVVSTAGYGACSGVPRDNYNTQISANISNYSSAAPGYKRHGPGIWDRPI